MSTSAKVTAIILAAGKSSRMRGPNKLLAEIGGEAIIRTVARAALASRAADVLVVTGNQAESVRAALAGLDVRFCNNPDFADGLSTSLRAGIGGVPPDSGAALVLLGDMPALSAAMIDRVIAAFNPAAGAEIVVATHGGQRGNPVLWPRRLFPALSSASGDVGGRAVMKEHAGVVAEVELGPAALLDLDTPEALAAAGGTFAKR